MNATTLKHKATRLIKYNQMKDPSCRPAEPIWWMCDTLMTDNNTLAFEILMNMDNKDNYYNTIPR